MIDQPNKYPCVFAALHQSQRIRAASPITSPIFTPLSILLGYTVATNRCLKDCPALSKATALLSLLSSPSSFQSP